MEMRRSSYLSDAEGCELRELSASMFPPVLSMNMRLLKCESSSVSLGARLLSNESWELEPSWELLVGLMAIGTTFSGVPRSYGLMVSCQASWEGNVKWGKQVKSTISNITLPLSALHWYNSVSECCKLVCDWYKFVNFPSSCEVSKRVQ